VCVCFSIQFDGIRFDRSIHWLICLCLPPS
jgi:hypothetical protein